MNEEKNSTIISINDVTADTGKTLDEVPESMGARATSMPSSVWDWSEGTYNADFEIQYEICYTKYKFTGYSSLLVTVIASRDRYTPASDVYYFYILTGSGQGTIKTSIELNSTEMQYLQIIDMDPGEKYAFAIVKANDGSVLSGSLSVYN